jgi:hypothetical protein
MWCALDTKMLEQASAEKAALKKAKALELEVKKTRESAAAQVAAAAAAAAASVDAAMKASEAAVAAALIQGEKNYISKWHAAAETKSETADMLSCVAASASARESGETQKLPRVAHSQGGRGSKGKGKTVCWNLPASQKGSHAASKRTNRKRARMMESVLEDLAGTGSENAASLLRAHKRRSPRTWSLMGAVGRQLTVAETAEMCNEVTGQLGHALRRHLKKCGVEVASRDKVRHVSRMHTHMATHELIYCDSCLCCR